jgi:hypothetical protein
MCFSVQLDEAEERLSVANLSWGWSMQVEAKCGGGSTGAFLSRGVSSEGFITPVELSYYNLAASIGEITDDTDVAKISFRDLDTGLLESCRLCLSWDFHAPRLVSLLIWDS